MSRSTAEIRQMFLDFFYKKGHEIVASSSLVPHNDSTILFTNAGMNQFKDVFLGQDKRSYGKATSAQRCVRAGGKHNDLDNVGYTARHHTFFEMLGNFSFGDYFKREAIAFAWELLTDKHYFALPKEKLLVTVYDTDQEAYDIWTTGIGLPDERVIRIGDTNGEPYFSDNFWQMGDTGPCGPSTEIFYDHGEEVWGGVPGSAAEGGDRFIEIWNIVFMQFDRQSNGILLPLPRPAVDTGMGLERIAAVLQGVKSNYDIDLFKELIRSAASVVGVNNLFDKSLRVLADHIRSCAYLIADGVIPTNEGRGYVLRRIIRRAIRHGRLLGAKEVFFYKLVQPLINVMESAASDLIKQRTWIEQILKTEEEQFLKTLTRGLNLLDEELSKLTGTTLDGRIVFKLYDTYGFPFDLTADICRERNIKIDEAAFEEAMSVQRQRARQSSQFIADYGTIVRFNGVTEFSGYHDYASEATVLAIFKNGESVSQIKAPDSAIVILSATPFYGESGGQIGDKGYIVANTLDFEVIDTQKYNQVVGHIGSLKQGIMNVGDTVSAAVNTEQRNKIESNHSATHLLQAALRQVLGDHVEQKGSLVTPDYLRFDFSHSSGLTESQQIEVENLVNRQIRRNLPVVTEMMSLDQAIAKGAMALFGEKYDKNVRVLSMGDFSIELCGGTHVKFTGHIGLFLIVAESGIAAGVRRIEAVTGQAAINWLHRDQMQLHVIAQLIKADKSVVSEKVLQLVDRVKQLEKGVWQLKTQQGLLKAGQILSDTVKINGVNVLIAEIKDVEAKIMRLMIDDIKNRINSGIIVLAAVNNEQINVAAAVTQDLVNSIKAGEIISLLAEQIGGKGGGRPDFAQAGGSDVAALPQAMLTIKKIIKERLM